MKVALFPSDRGGCGSYRITWPGKALFDKGYDVKEYPRPQLLHQGDKVYGLAQSLPVDVVIFQRPARKQYLDAFKYFQSVGIKVVVDFDDDLSIIHPKNPAYAPYNDPKKDMHWEWSMKAAEMADLVTCTTPALLETYGFGHGVIIPNFIPERYLDTLRMPTDRVTVGWIGNVATHPTDLLVTHGSINQALADTKTKSAFLACDPNAFPALGVRNRDPHRLVPGVPLEQYPNLVGLLDVGIVPLDRSPFNEAKSWLKGLEYAACGVAPVVTPTYDNQRLVDAGAAYSAANPKEWKEAVSLLIKDDSERESLVKRAKEFASANTIEGNCELWWEAWSALV